MATKLAQGGAALSGAAIDSHGVVHVCDSQTGSVYRVENGSLTEIVNTQGQPVALAFDPSSGALHICDLVHHSILRLEGGSASNSGDSTVLTELVKEFNRQPLRGPNALAFTNDGTLYFSDAGPLGSSSLGRPIGSIFSVSQEPTLLLQPIVLESFAHPSSLCLVPATSSTSSPPADQLFVCELLQNRLVRFAQRPKGVFHHSVFHHFSGGMGPSACVCTPDGATLYVGRYDFRTTARQGVVTIIDCATGRVRGEISVPGPEITGLALDAAKNVLIIVEASQNTVYSHPI